MKSIRNVILFSFVLSVVLLVELFQSVPAFSASTPAKAKPAKPSKTIIKPLALEYRLLAQLSKTQIASNNNVIKHAKYLTNFGGSGYSIQSLPKNNYAASKQRKIRQRIYLALTEPHLKSAYARVKNLLRNNRTISLKPGRASKYRKSRAYKIYTYSSGINNSIAHNNKLISLQQNRRVATPEESIGIQQQINTLQNQNRELRTLEEDLNELIPSVLGYDSFSNDINTSGSKDTLSQKTDSLKKQAAQLASTTSGITKAEAVGTQQVRITISEKKRQEILNALTNRIGKETDRIKKKINFIKGKIDFLPLLWPLTKKIQPVGDYHITEYVCGEELFLTLFDCSGLWHRIIALEYNKKIFLLLKK